MWSDIRLGFAAIAPMLLGVIPFGLVAGATPVLEGFGAPAALGLSTILFAGASQLATVEALASGGSAVVAAVAACTINLRMLLYSASLAPYVAHERMGRRLLIAYLMTDQAYAMSITRWSVEDPPQPERRFPYYLGAGALLWFVWQISVLVGALAGNAIPDEIPLDFAVPLVFLVLLVPALTTPAAAVAAVVGGVGAVVAAELGAGSLYILIGALSGIAAGTAVAAVTE
jgi:predicted branched-subunit amino acid permease